jgi:hypothetical protein
VAVSIERLSLRVLAGHIGDGLAYVAANACPPSGCVAGFEPEKLAEHFSTKTRRQAHDRFAIWSDIPPERELQQVTTRPMLRHAPSFAES